MAASGSFRERWQYRQEMKAYGAWNSWGFPTREDFAQFSDARNLVDLLKTWRPHTLEAYGLGEQGFRPLTQTEKETAYALLDKRTEEGLSEAEVRTYAQLLNRWQAEHQMLAGDAWQAHGQLPVEEAHRMRSEPHRTTEDLGFVVGEPARRELTSAEVAALETRWEVLEEREALVEERVGPLVSAQEGERWLQALRDQMDQTSAWTREPDGLVIRDLRERMDALMAPAETTNVQLRPEEITERIAALLEEAQRQGLVVTGQETPQLSPKQRRGY